MRRVDLPIWAHPFLKPSRYKVAMGGRGSGKTWTIAMVLALMASERKMRVACCREYQKSLRESAKKAIEIAIIRAGLRHRYDVQANRIVGRNGSEFFFHGFERSREEMRGWEDVDVAWIEEAQRLTRESWEILLPSIRKPGSELWFTYNPRFRADTVSQAFGIGKPRAGSLVRKVNWRDNPWFPKELQEERLECLRDEPDRYEYIWEGGFDDEGAERHVLSYAVLMDCVKAFEQGLAPKGGVCHAGLDVADSGADRSAQVFRRGPVIEGYDVWRAKYLSVTAQRAHTGCIESGAVRLYYDGGGVGAGVRSDFAKMASRPYIVRPENFGGAVQGKDVTFSYRTPNGDFFDRRNSQMAWAVRLRAQNTQRLMNGEGVDPRRCLFINPALKDLEGFLSQLSQPLWEENVRGKVVIEKSPDDAPSPDLYDATVLAFAADSVSGLKAR